MVGRLTRAGSILLLAVLAACAAPQTERLLDNRQGLPPRAEVASVPFFPQTKHYCGPAALATALAWSGVATSQAAVARQVFTPGRQGTLLADIVGGARRNGRLAIPVRDLRDLLREIAAGHPVIVFQNLGLDIVPLWHFAVAVGYDLDQGEIVLRSGRRKRRLTRLDTFEHTWRRAGQWALVVTPPDEFPATAGEGPVLCAAAALERAGRHIEAVLAYSAAAECWRDSLGALMGLGNAFYALGEVEGAEAAFRGAAERHPEAAAAWNNLAVVLGELGRRKEAVAAAKRAVSLGGDAYRGTLGEVSPG